MNTSVNPADVGTHENACKNYELLQLWIEVPAFLMEGQEDVKSLSCAPIVRMVLYNENTIFETDDKIFKLMQTSRDLHTLKKWFAYLLAFVELVKAKFKRKPFQSQSSVLLLWTAPLLRLLGTFRDSALDLLLRC